MDASPHNARKDAGEMFNRKEKILLTKISLGVSNNHLFRSAVSKISMSLMGEEERILDW